MRRRPKSRPSRCHCRPRNSLPVSVPKKEGRPSGRPFCFITTSPRRARAPTSEWASVPLHPACLEQQEGDDHGDQNGAHDPKPVREEKEHPAPRLGQRGTSLRVPPGRVWGPASVPIRKQFGRRRVISPTHAPPMCCLCWSIARLGKDSWRSPEFLQHAASDDRVVKAMTAYEAALNELGLAQRTDPLTGDHGPQDYRMRAHRRARSQTPV